MVGLTNGYAEKFPINSRIKVNENYGTVKYVGEVTGHPGLWVGVEWDDSRRGKHDGVVNGVRYFQTKNRSSGSLVRPEKIEGFESLEEAAKDRYLRNNENALDQTLIRETQMHLQASLFEIVGMDKIARKQSKFEELFDISVENSGVNCAGNLTSFEILSTLDLTSSLVWNWNIIADITSQVPTLIDLNLSSNRLQVPTKQEIVDLEPSFRNLKHINLRKCGITNWADVITTAKLWPNIESLGLQENDISELTPVDCMEIFRNLREIDLHRTKLSDFNEICKLGNIKTLTSLLLMENGIEEVVLPDCEPNKKLNIFQSLEKLNLYDNPIKDKSNFFNELDKLPSLKNLSKTADRKTGFEDMFSMAVALIPNLKILNKVEIINEQRRGAEYDIWKQYGTEWVKVENDPKAIYEFCKKYRAYSKIVEKCGSPAEFAVRPVKKVSNLITIKIQNKITGEIWEKKIPRKISVQTLQGLIIKHFQMEITMPQLCYIDAKRPDLIVNLDNQSKTLDFYSIQDGDFVTMEW